MRVVTLFVRVFALMLAVVAGQQPAATPPAAGQNAQGKQPEAPKKARVEGKVISLTGEAVPRAQIRMAGPTAMVAGALTQGAAVTATADDAGGFVVENIDPGKNYQLTAQRPGFEMGRYGARSSSSTQGAPISLDAGQTLKGLVITMTPQGVVSGRVLDQAGDPLQGAIVFLMRSGYQRGVKQMMPSTQAQSDDQGAFRIANVMPGRYYLSVSDRRTLESSASATQLRNVTTFYPNATEMKAAAPLDVAAGSEVRGLDIRLRQARVFSARGKMVDPNGAPVAAASGIAIAKADLNTPLTILTQLSAGQLQARSADGSFEVRNLAPGAYEVIAVTNVQGTASGPRLSGRIDLNITDADVANLAFPLGVGATINGSIRMEEGDMKALLPPANPASASQATLLALTASNAGIVVTGARLAVGLTDLSGFSVPAPPAQLKDDGTFVMEGIAPSRFQLSIAALPQGTYVKSARLGGSDVTKSEIDLRSGSGGNLEIVLSNKAADITGNVRSEKNDSMAGVAVSLWSRDSEPGTSANGVKIVYADQNG
ncbi:MAG: carboxypeptidase-like regulatory domain-containing protein, partial [Acidobacteriota bacterium]